MSSAPLITAVGVKLDLMISNAQSLKIGFNRACRSFFFFFPLKIVHIHFLKHLLRKLMGNIRL